ncbi:MAG: nuclear transport factor 2 family protein [Actinomycetota bacterium]
MTDRDEIVDIAARYTWAIDTRDYGALADVFTPDAYALLGGEACHGLGAIQDRVARALDPLDASQHLVGSHVVDLGIEGNPDRARHRCQFQAQHCREGANYIVAGSYSDRFVRTADGWRIEHRVLDVTWTEGDLSVLRRG